MEKFVFNGDWKFDMIFPVLSKINDNHWYSGNLDNPTNQKLLSGNIEVEIIDTRDDNPDPEASQLATLEYIRSNERVLIESLIDHLNRVVNPAHVSYCGDDEWVEEITGLENIGKTVRITQIQILNSEKDGLAYYAFMMEYIGDYEHGLVLTYYKDKMLGFAGSCEVDYEAIVKDQGGISPEQYQQNVDRNSYGERMIHFPDEKYGKLKPWKLDETGSQLSRMLKNESNNEEIITLIETGKLDPDIPIDSYWGHGLLSLAVYQGNFEIIKYLLGKGGCIGKNILRYTGRAFDGDKLIKMIELGGDIDELHNRINITSLMIEINTYFQLHINHLRTGGSRPEENYKLEQSENRIRSYINLGADPNNCNDRGQDYATIIKQARPNFEKDLETIAKIDSILYPNKIFKPSAPKKIKEQPSPNEKPANDQKKLSTKGDGKSFWGLFKFWK